MEVNPEHAIAYGIFSYGQARDAGFSEAAIRAQVRRGAWARSSRGVLEVVGREPGQFDQLVRQALSAGPRAIVGFAPAARIYGWDLPALPRLPEIIVPTGSRCPARCHRSPVGEDEQLVRGPLTLTTPARTAADLAVVLPLQLGVVVLDSAMRAGLRRERLDEAIRRRRSRVARRASELADPLSGSVPESQARMVFHAAGLPPPCTQYAIRIGGRSYRADFAWPQWWLVVEIDGREFHIGEAPFQTDRTRQNALLQAGWHVLRFTVADVRFRPDYVIAEIRFALERASTAS